MSQKKEKIIITIDDMEVKAGIGESLLWCALDNDIYIPNLCAIRDNSKPLAACRLCYVEIDGLTNPITACAVKVKDGMRVRLNTERVKRIRNTAFELLLSHHHLDCTHCPKNGHCELQNIAARLRIKLKLTNARKLPMELPVDLSHALFYYDPNKCVLCGKCIWTCRQNGKGILDFSFKGIDTMVSTFAGLPLAETECNGCLACVTVCPVAALVKK